MLDGLTHWLKTYGDTGDASFEDFKEGVSESTFGDVNAIKSVITTGGTAQDWIAVAMLLTPAGGKGKNALQNNITDTPNNKKTPTETDTSNNKKNDENASVKPKNTIFDTENQNKKGEAYAEGGDAPITKETLKQKPKHSPDPKTWKDKGGKVEILEDGTWRYTDWEGNVVDYVNGYPVFKIPDHVRQSVDIGKQKGDYKDDYKKAEKLSDKNPPKLSNKETTWHHHEDGKTMQEIDKVIHKRFTHSGGISKTKKINFKK